MSEKAKSEGAMTLREYARSRKRSPAAVHKAIVSGRISRRQDGLIDPVEADRAWARNTRPTARTAHPSLIEERLRRERAEASLAEAKLARLQGEVILIDEAAELWEDAIGRMRARMLASIGSAAPRLVGLKSQREAGAVLQAIVFDALAAAAAVADEIEVESSEKNS